MSVDPGPFAGLRLEHSSTVDRVVEELRRAVFEGELESGTPLREVALAASLRVSRPRVREALAAFTAATTEPASYQVLNERHLAFHLSLVGLAESPRLEAMATSVYAELRLALAQVDRARQNAPDQAGSHALLVELLESGDLAATVAELERHLTGAEVAILERLHLDG